MTKYNILIIVSNYYPIFGGAEKQAQLQAEELVKRGHNVSVLTALRDNSSQQETINNVTIKRVKYPKIKLIGALIFYGKITMHLLTNNKKYQIYHIHMVKNLAFIASILGAFQSKKTLLKFTGWWELETGVLNQTQNKTLKNKILLWGLRKADHYIAISDEIFQKALQAGFKKDKVIYIPNGVDIGLFQEKAAPPLPSSLPIIVLFIGRLVEEKGLFVLLEAWQQIAQKRHDCRLDIVGDGPLREQLERMAVRLRIKENVRFWGKSDNPARHYAQADIYVLPSFHEGLSNTLLEAMASELPVVSTKISGTLDIVENQSTGLLIEPGDPDMLAQSILKLLDSKKLRHNMGKQARQVIKNRFSIETVVSQIEALYTMETHC